MVDKSDESSAASPGLKITKGLLSIGKSAERVNSRGAEPRDPTNRDIMAAFKSHDSSM